MDRTGALAPAVSEAWRVSDADREPLDEDDGPLSTLRTTNTWPHDGQVASQPRSRLANFSIRLQLGQANSLPPAWNFSFSGFSACRETSEVTLSVGEQHPTLRGGEIQGPVQVPQDTVWITTPLGHQPVRFTQRLIRLRIVSFVQSNSPNPACEPIPQNLANAERDPNDLQHP